MPEPQKIWILSSRMTSGEVVNMAIVEGKADGHDVANGAAVEMASLNAVPIRIEKFGRQRGTSQ